MPVSTISSYVFHFPDTMSHAAEKSCLDLGTSYQASRIYIKVTTPRKRLTEFVCWKANKCCKVFLQVNFKEKPTFRTGVYQFINSLWSHEMHKIFFLNAFKIRLVLIVYVCFWLQTNLKSPVHVVEKKFLVIIGLGQKSKMRKKRVSLLRDCRVIYYIVLKHSS